MPRAVLSKFAPKLLQLSLAIQEVG